jgi:hypothetical protein
LHPLAPLILLSPLYGVGWESLQIPLFSVKIAKSPCFISLIHIDKGDLGPTSQIALGYLPSSLMSYIKFGCNSSPLDFHTLQRTQWTWFSHACKMSDIMQTPRWFWSKKQPGPKPKGYCGNICHWLAKPHLIVVVVGVPTSPGTPKKSSWHIGKNAYLRNCLFSRLITPSGIISSVLGFAYGPSTHS